MWMIHNPDSGIVIYIFCICFFFSLADRRMFYQMRKSSAESSFFHTIDIFCETILVTWLDLPIYQWPVFPNHCFFVCVHKLVSDKSRWFIAFMHFAAAVMACLCWTVRKTQPTGHIDYNVQSGGKNTEKDRSQEWSNDKVSSARQSLESIVLWTKSTEKLHLKKNEPFLMCYTNT